MTDLEICKRIAEIEGLKVVGDNLKSVNIEASNECLLIPCHIMYNPLTDDALTWRLMVKYELILAWCPYTKLWECYKRGIKTLIMDKLSNRAVCLALLKLAEIESELGKG